MSNSFTTIDRVELVWREGRPYSALTDTLYPVNEDMLDQSEFIYIGNNQLIPRWQALDSNEKTSFVIAETKFGTGLNLLVSWFHWLQHAPITARLHYICCDNQPLHRRDLNQILAMWPQFRKQAQLLLEEYPILTPGFHHFVFDEDRISVTLMLGEPSICFKQLLLCGEALLEKKLRTNFVDAWFLNSGTTDELLKSMAMLSKPEATLAAHSYSELMKINLQDAGFRLNKTHATFEGPSKSHKKRNTPWHVATPQPIKAKKAIVIGAGLAGCFTAYSLVKRGWEILLVDAGDEVATGASGNTQAVLYPKLSAFSSPLTEFMLTAYLYATRFYSKLLKTHPIGSLSGILQLAYNPKAAASQQSMQALLKSYPELGRLVDTCEASLLAGMPMQWGGLYLPLSGCLDCKSLCHFLIENPGIQWIPNKDVQKLDYEQGQWSIGDYQAETVIIANGFQANQFEQTAHLPLKSISGLLTSIASNDVTQHLKIPLCGEGHILPASGDAHVLGATYHPGAVCIPNKTADDLCNLAKLASFSREQPFSRELISNWSGTRAAAPDYLPLVGPVPDSHAFQQTYHTLATDSKRWLPVAGDYYQGLYLCSGFGSRGLTTAPLCGEWLASLINNEPSFIPRHFTQLLSPSRFLIKKIAKKSA